MTRERRLEKINELLILNEHMSVTELSHRMKVTKETIRKDLSHLEKKGVVYRVHGGAALRNNCTDIPYDIRLGEYSLVKRKISSKALSLIQDEDVVFVDPSTTILHLSKLIKLKQRVLVVTNCLTFVQNLDFNTDSVILGGNFSYSGQRTMGQFTIDMLSKINISISFFGSDGCKGIMGPGTQSEDAMFMNQYIIKKSKINVLALDASKFDIVSRYQFANFDDFDYIITDDRISPDFLNTLRQSKAEVIVA